MEEFLSYTFCYVVKVINPCPLIISGDVARVNGQLAVSRAFGDKNLKSHLRSDPDITSADVDGDTDLLIIASDGVWKVKPSLSLAFLSWGKHGSYAFFIYIYFDLSRSWLTKRLLT